MRWGEPDILLHVSETALTKFALDVGSPNKRYGGVVLSALILAALWFVLCKQLSGEWSVNEQYNYVGSFLFSPSTRRRSQNAYICVVLTAV